MATRQYIGARYVPKFSDPIKWDKERSYEALTIVTYLNNSYTSKKPVPIGIDITNKEYWVVTGNYNSQVEEYRQQTVDVSNRVDKTEKDIQAINNELDNVNLREKTNVSNKRIIMIGDSYGVKYLENDGGWVGWGYQFETNYPNTECYVSAVGGAGLTIGTTFLAQLQNISNSVTNKDTITDIIVMGGYNDAMVGLTLDQIKNALNEISSYVKKIYPYAKLSVGFLGVDYNTGSKYAGQSKCYTTATLYRSACSTLDISYIFNSEYILCNKDYIWFHKTDANSGFHPNTLGCFTIANLLHQYLEQGYFDVIYGEYVSTLGANIFMKNGYVYIEWVTESVPMINLLNNFSLPFSTWTSIADLSLISKLLWGTENKLGTANFYAPVVSVKNGEQVITGWYKFRIFKKKLEMLDFAHAKGTTFGGPSEAPIIIVNNQCIPPAVNYS